MVTVPAAAAAIRPDQALKIRSPADRGSRLIMMMIMMAAATAARAAGARMPGRVTGMQ
jgi:hypothetical protein